MLDRVRLALAACCIALALGGGVGAGASTAPTVKVFFGQGEQLVAAARPGSTVQDALAALVAAPTSAEKKQSFRSYVPQARASAASRSTARSRPSISAWASCRDPRPTRRSRDWTRS
jgi:integral membrane sensor domain MASE1